MLLYGIGTCSKSIDVEFFRKINIFFVEILKNVYIFAA